MRDAFGLLVVLVVWGFVFYIAYLVIKAAVRNGFDESKKAAELEKLLTEIRDELRNKEREEGGKL
ncbi:hypothetical protein [Brevibacillus borstelensis]|uniref:hypothetical protein n=1 Tax=Brevibacillus borstelensis TaxID=45462 RepID=UPI0030BB25E4